MIRCEYCGAFVPDLGVHSCTGTIPLQHKDHYWHHCEHCFCKRGLFIENQEHLVCCMCGHRRLVNPITF